MLTAKQVDTQTIWQLWSMPKNNKKTTCLPFHEKNIASTTMFANLVILKIKAKSIVRTILLALIYFYIIRHCGLFSKWTTWLSLGVPTWKMASMEQKQEHRGNKRGSIMPFITQFSNKLLHPQQRQGSNYLVSYSYHRCPEGEVTASLIIDCEQQLLRIAAYQKAFFCKCLLLVLLIDPHPGQSSIL